MNLKDPAFYVGLAVTILSALGLISADEGADLTTYALGAATGIIGLWKLVPAIVKRHRADNGE